MSSDPCLETITCLDGFSCPLKPLQALELLDSRIRSGSSLGCCCFRGLFLLFDSVRLDEELVGEEAGGPKNQETENEEGKEFEGSHNR